MRHKWSSESVNFQSVVDWNENTKNLKNASKFWHKVWEATDHEECIDQQLYQLLKVCCIYLAMATRPDISFAVSNVAKFSAQPTKQHWITVKLCFFTFYCPFYCSCMGSLILSPSRSPSRLCHQLITLTLLLMRVNSYMGQLIKPRVLRKGLAEASQCTVSACGGHYIMSSVVVSHCWYLSSFGRWKDKKEHIFCALTL